MLRTVIIRSKDRIAGGTAGDYQVRLTGAFDPDVDYYKVRLSNWNGFLGGTGTPAAVRYSIQMNASFYQPYSFNTSRTSNNETLAILNMSGATEYTPQVQSFETIIRRPTMDVLRIWFVELYDEANAFVPAEHIFVLEFEPVPKK
jgi:hypothetical protein